MHSSRTVEFRLRAAVESSPSGLLMIDARGVIVLVNREVERLFGYAREELLGQPVEMLVPERFRDAHPGWRGGFLAEPRARAMGAGRELFGLRKDGDEIPIEIGLTPVATDEGFFVISSIVDISARTRAEADRRLLEEQLRQAQKMEAVGRLAGGIAHDFNNILGTIVGYAELARDAAVRPDVIADLDDLLRSAARGKELIDRILRFSRHQTVAPVTLDLASTVSDAWRMLRATLPATIEMQLSLDAAPHPVRADATSIHQVMMNLATNAADAMPDGGLLEVRLEPFYVRDSFARTRPGLHEGPYVLLTVRDTGHGMDEATRGRAFEPFFTTKPPGSGSGLGLSMVHAIVRDHDGAVWIDSVAGAGTAVSCLLPALTEDLPEPGVGEPEAPRGSGEHLLYVDDEPTLLRVGERRLTALGYRVTVMTDPVAALQRLRSSPEEFDGLITDHAMPRMTGLQLARQARDVRPDLPVLLLTGYLKDFTVEELSEMGIDHVLSKPVTTTVLARTLRAMLERA